MWASQNPERFCCWKWTRVRFETDGRHLLILADSGEVDDLLGCALFLNSLRLTGFWLFYFRAMSEVISADLWLSNIGPQVVNRETAPLCWNGPIINRRHPISQPNIL